MAELAKSAPGMASQVHRQIVQRTCQLLLDVRVEIHASAHAKWRNHKRRSGEQEVSRMMSFTLESRLMYSSVCYRASMLLLLLSAPFRLVS